MKRQRKITSIDEQVRIASMAMRIIGPPATVPLSDDDMPFFNNVIAEFARSEWTAHSLELAAMLARMLADMAREQALMREEGSVVPGTYGSVPNPRRGIIQMHANMIVNFRRSLALHARAMGGERRDVAARRQVARGVDAAVTGAGDDLIARPEAA